MLKVGSYVSQENNFVVVDVKLSFPSKTIRLAYFSFELSQEPNIRSESIGQKKEKRKRKGTHVYFSQ